MTTYHFTSIDQRNAFIEKCYKEGVKYAYYDKDKENKYKVITYEEKALHTADNGVNSLKK